MSSPSGPVTRMAAYRSPLPCKTDTFNQNFFGCLMHVGSYESDYRAFVEVAMLP